jgi:hypothetical protein
MTSGRIIRSNKEVCSSKQLIEDHLVVLVEMGMQATATRMVKLTTAIKTVKQTTTIKMELLDKEDR